MYMTTFRWIIAVLILFATALPVNAARAPQTARRYLPTSCAVFSLDHAVTSYVSCSIKAVSDLNTRQYGWLAFLGVLLATAMLASSDYTLPRKTAYNVAIYLAGGGLFALYGYLLTS
jgi:hypothetical protein